MTAIQLAALVLRADDPAAIARFWARALGGTTDSAEHERVTVRPDDVTSFELLVRQAAGEKRGQNRIHFDLTTDSSA